MGIEKIEPNTEPVVYQVRAKNILGRERIVHSYPSEQEARSAIAFMKKGKSALRHGVRYTVVPAKNDPTTHWGINFPDPKIKTGKK